MFATIFSDSSDVTVVLTSCGRFDLLRRTIESFLLFNTYPIKGFIITEDSGDERVRECVPESLVDKFTFVVNSPKLGQMKSIDTGYALVDTDYIFHCEDDWEFYRTSFIEDSKKILEADHNILQVWLRSYYHDIRIHSGYHFWGDKKNIGDVVFYRVMSSKPDWQGFSFNPGLRRLEDYKRVGPYSGYESEKSLSKLYHDEERWAVALEADAVAHLGFGEHVADIREVRKKRRRKKKQFLIVAVSFCFGIGSGILILEALRMSL